MTIRAARIASLMPDEWTEGWEAQRIEPLIWGPVHRTKTEHEVRGVLAALLTMTAEEWAAAFPPDVVTYSGPMLFAHRCLEVELAKPEAERDWGAATALADAFLELSQRPGAEAFRAPLFVSKR